MSIYKVSMTVINSLLSILINFMIIINNCIVSIN